METEIWPWKDEEPKKGRERAGNCSVAGTGKGPAEKELCEARSLKGIPTVEYKPSIPCHEDCKATKVQREKNEEEEKAEEERRGRTRSPSTAAAPKTRLQNDGTGSSSSTAP